MSGVSISTGPEGRLPELAEALHTIIGSADAYRSWGRVDVEALAVRCTDGTFARLDLDDPGKSRIAADRSELASIDPVASVIFRKRRRINAVMFTRQEQAAFVDEDIPPILDDQAQLLGPSLRFVPAPVTPGRVRSALRGRYAAILSGGRTVCIGQDIEAAFIAAQLVEKTSKAFIEARSIGGARSINRLEAWAMHKFYMLKYSRESEKNR